VSDEEAPRPGWPGGAPAPDPAPPLEPAPATEPAARPSWDRAPSLARRTLDIKLVIAVLIGLVSVTGAAMAWKSAISGEKATDKDRQAVAETVTVEQARANNEVIVQDARERFAEHAIGVVNAEQLQIQADDVAADGDADRARALDDEATELRVVARRSLEGGLAPVFLADYITEGAAGERPTFDEATLTRDLERISAAQQQLDPVQTIRDADRLRNESERFDRWLIFMVAAVVLLTLAQIAGHKLVRLGLTGVGTSVWIVSAILAWSGS
jgi:hypothetical protein